MSTMMPRAGARARKMRIFAAYRNACAGSQRESENYLLRGSENKNLISLTRILSVRSLWGTRNGGHPMRRLMLALVATLLVNPAQAADVSLLNVSYDPTRELYVAL